MTNKAQRSASFWLISRNGKISFVCVEIHGADQELLNHNSEPATSYHHGEAKAIAYAAQYGVGEDRLSYDHDSTICFAEGPIPHGLPGDGG